MNDTAIREDAHQERWLEYGGHLHGSQHVSNLGGGVIRHLVIQIASPRQPSLDHRVRVHDLTVEFNPQDGRDMGGTVGSPPMRLRSPPIRLLAAMPGLSPAKAKTAPPRGSG